jgi:hypothetical protein
MGIQVRNNYQAAFSTATDQLQSIYNEYHELQIRKERLEGVVTALQPFLESRSQAHQDLFVSASSIRDFMEPAPSAVQEAVARYERTVLPVQQPVQQPIQPVQQVQAVIEPMARFEQPEPVAVPAPIQPPSFASLEDSLDPLQLRINRALGLAVA